MIGQGSKRRAEFERIVLPQVDSLYGAAFRLCRNGRDAEDLVQETLLRAYRFWDSFKRDSNVRAWLFKIQTNTFINTYQKRKRRREVLDKAMGEQDATDGVLYQAQSLDRRNPEKTLLDRTMSEDVSHALAEMPADFRTAVVLCDVEGFSYKEIAEVTGLTSSYVGVLLHTAIRKLKDKLIQ